MLCLIDIINIHHSYNNRKPILQGASLQIYQGDWISIVGQSGTGKTTLLKCITGLLVPNRGTVEYDNENILDLSKDELSQFRRKNIGFVFQNFKLIPYYSAVENVMVPFMYDLEHSLLKERAENALSQVGLSSSLFKRTPHQLSGGEKQRVAIARAIVTTPKVIVCDEPTGNLDIESRDNIISVLRNLRKEGQTIIMVTHDMDLARSSDNIYTLKEGILSKNDGRCLP